MTVMTDKVVQNSILTLIARGAMFVSFPIMVWIAGYVQGLGDDVNKLNLKVATIEQRMNYGQDNEDEQMEQINARLKTLEERTILILQQVAGLAANENRPYR